MSLTYIVEPNNRKYVFSYQQLKEDYHKYSTMFDEEFLQNLPQILHFICVVGYVKELGNELLADDGLIHQLVHLMVSFDETKHELKNIRQLFDVIMRLD